MTIQNYGWTTNEHNDVNNDDDDDDDDDNIVMEVSIGSSASVGSSLRFEES